MVDLKAIFEYPETANSDSKCGRNSSIHFCSTKVGSLDRAESARSNEPTFVDRGEIPDERDAIKAEFCVKDRPQIVFRSTI